MVGVPRSMDVGMGVGWRLPVATDTAAAKPGSSEVSTFCRALYARNRTMKLPDSSRMLTMEFSLCLCWPGSTSWIDLRHVNDFTNAEDHCIRHGIAEQWGLLVHGDGLLVHVWGYWDRRLERYVLEMRNAHETSTRATRICMQVRCPRYTPACTHKVEKHGTGAAAHQRKDHTANTRSATWHAGAAAHPVSRSTPAPCAT